MLCVPRTKCVHSRCVYRGINNQIEKKVRNFEFALVLRAIALNMNIKFCVTCFEIIFNANYKLISLKYWIIYAHSTVIPLIRIILYRNRVERNIELLKIIEKVKQVYDENTCGIYYKCIILIVLEETLHFLHRAFEIMFSY